MASFTLRSTIAAPVEVVFDVLTDHRGYSRLTPLRSSTLEREGQPAPNGVGAIRVLKLAGPPIREEVTEFDAPTRFAYRALSGIPAKSHVGTVDLSAAGSATELVWTVDTTPSLPIPGPAWAVMVRPAIVMLLRGIKRESERLGSAAG
jgi:ligand-binding SRPBCC domain-containing protein